jgi:hypothetical protein
LFLWSWSPKWYTLARKRQLYADFAQHLARRGTRIGIEGFLKAFSTYARVYNRPMYWGEFVWGEPGWTISHALGVVVQISHLADEVNHDTRGMAWGEFVLGEGFYRDVEPTLTNREIEDLIRFQWPNSNRVMVDYQVRPNVAGYEGWEKTIPWDEETVPDENSGPMV